MLDSKSIESRFYVRPFYPAKTDTRFLCYGIILERPYVYFRSRRYRMDSYRFLFLSGLIILRSTPIYEVAFVVRVRRFSISSRRRIHLPCNSSSGDKLSSLIFNPFIVRVNRSSKKLINKQKGVCFFCLFFFLLTFL